VDVLHDDEALRIELHTHTPARDTVVLTFDPILWPQTARPFGVDFLVKSGVDAICVRKKEEHFYQPLSREQLAALLAPVLARYRQRMAYGSSLGAYAVLYYAAHGFDMVISSSPRISIHPDHGIEHWQRKVRFRHQRLDPKQPATSPAVIFYDPKDEQDRRFVDEEIRPAWPTAQFVPIPYAGHPANQFLAEIGYITPCVRDLVHGLPLPPLTRRHKARSGMYHQVLASACLARGKLNWALALAERAMVLSPYLNLGRRTLGEIHLARGELDAAQAHLDWYLERSPQDGPALQARERLQRRRLAADAEGSPADEEDDLPGPAGVAAPTVSPVRPSPPTGTGVWRRAAGWLRARMAPSGASAAAAGPAVTRDDVIWAYRQFLGRAPESEQVIEAHCQHASVRTLVQSFLDSAEYRRREQQGATGAGLTSGLAVRQGVWRRDGPVVLMLGNCQAPGVASVLAACTEASEVIPLTSLNRSEQAQREQLLAHAARADVWFINPVNRLAREVFAQAARPGARLVTLPALHFNAFHPDVCYAMHRGSQQLTQQHYNSALVVWAYGAGLGPEEAAALFNAETYRAVGYLGAWSRAVAGLQDTFRRSDLADDFAPFMQRVQRLGCFMHTPNHPHLAVLAQLAQLAAKKAGLALVSDLAVGELVDGLAGTVWPVYPEIARALALDGGSLQWKFLTSGEHLDGVAAYVQHAYAAYQRQGIAPADLEIRWADGAALDRTLRALTGRPPR
jgi:tetratricopeptide (TPR) repeat protein